MRLLISFILFGIILSCNDNRAKPRLISVNLRWIDSVKKVSDTSWSKKYRNNDFVKADYFFTQKDSLLTQVMRDSFDNIRQILVAKNEKTRLLFQQFYSNGQLMASLQLDKLGRFNGEAVYYYDNGQVKSRGIYTHGFYMGQWINFDIAGKYSGTDEYNDKGVLVKTK